VKKNILVYAIICIILLVTLAGGALTNASTLLGDADMNGSISANDAALILRHLVRLSNLSGQALINADVDLNGVVNAADAAAILRSLVRLDTLPPSGTSVTHGPTSFRTPSPPPTPTPNPELGDVDRNGQINAADAALILRHLVRLSALNARQLLNADVNLDGKVTAADAAAILRFLVRLDTLPPRPPPVVPVTAIPTPYYTPVPTNKYGGPMYGDTGLVVHNDDPNIDKIYNLVRNRILWKRSSGTSSSGFNYPLSPYNVASQATVGWCYMSFRGAQNGSSPNYSPSLNANTTYYIDEPILWQTNSYFLFNDIEDGKSSDGTKSTLISVLDRAAQNIVITGHNSRSTRTHFHHLHSLQNGAKYYYGRGAVVTSDYTYPNIRITMFGRYKWQIWAIYECGPSEPAFTFEYATNPSCGTSTPGKTVQEWINFNMAKSEVRFGVSVSPDDQFMTLYTCGDKYERTDESESHLYVFLKLIP